jgi:hypothetical protein
MKPVFDQAQAMQDANAAFLRVREMHGSEQYRLFADWIEALAAQQQAALIDSEPEKYAQRNARLSAILAMARALNDAEPRSAGFII